MTDVARRRLPDARAAQRAATGAGVLAAALLAMPAAWTMLASMSAQDTAGVASPDVGLTSLPSGAAGVALPMLLLSTLAVVVLALLRRLYSDRVVAEARRAPRRLGTLRPLLYTAGLWTAITGVWVSILVVSLPLVPLAPAQRALLADLGSPVAVVAFSMLFVASGYASWWAHLRVRQVEPLQRRPAMQPVGSAI